MDAVPGDRRQTENAEDSVDRTVEKPDRRDENVAEDYQGKSGKQGRVLSPSNGDGLGYELSKHDVEKRDEQVRRSNCNSMRSDCCSQPFDPDPFHRGKKELGKGRLSYEPQPDARQGDTHLAHGEVLVQ